MFDQSYDYDPGDFYDEPPPPDGDGLYDPYVPDENENLEIIGSIEYESKYIPLILNKTKFVTIRRTAYKCGVYNVINKDSGNVECQIEITETKKIDMVETIMSFSVLAQLKAKVNEFDYPDYLNDYVFGSGFNSIDEFNLYHLNNYSKVKYVHIFQLLDNHS